MKKVTLINKLKAKGFYKKVVQDPLLIESKPDGTKLYQLTILEKKDDVGIARNVRFYVIDEGLPSEEALWKDYEPAEMITDKDAGRPVTDKDAGRPV